MLNYVVGSVWLLTSNCFGATLVGNELTTWYIDGESLSYWSEWSSAICGAYDESSGNILMWEPYTASGNVYAYDVASKSLEYVEYITSIDVYCANTPSSFFYNNLLWFYDDDNGIGTFHFDITGNNNYGTKNVLSPPEYFDDPCFMLSKDETKFYLVGDDVGSSKNFYIYDTELEAWTQSQSTIYTHGEAPCAISSNNELYIIGALEHGYIEKINLDTLNSWQILSPTIPVSGDQGYGRSAVIMENIIYIFGGDGQSNIYYINTNDDTLSSISTASAQIPLYYTFPVAVTKDIGGDDRIYMFGGRDFDGNDVQTIRYSNTLIS